MKTSSLVIILPVVLSMIISGIASYVLIDLERFQDDPSNILIFLIGSVLLLGTVSVLFVLTFRRIIRTQEKDIKLLNRQHTAMERKLDMSESLTKVTNRISDLHETFSLSRDLDVVLNQAVAALKDIFSADTLVLQLYSDEESRFFMRIEEGGEDIPLGEELPLEVIQDGKSRLINNLSQFPNYSELDEAGFTSMIVAPLNRFETWVQRKSIGFTAVLSKERRDFTSSELDLLTTFSTHAALLIENARLYKRVELLAIHDGLTNLFNHRHFQTVLEAEVEKTERSGVPLTLLILDIDDFKKYNDAFGHPEGDDALRGVSDILMDNTRGKDFVARYGGEEFVVILPETSREGAMTVAQTIRQKIEAYAFKSDDPNYPPVQLSITAGLAVFPDDARTAKDLIASADEALYKGKRNGKNQVVSVA